METDRVKLLLRVASLLLLANLGLAAPGLPGTQRDEPAEAQPPPAAVQNPFGTGEEDRRLLQSYVQSRLQDGQGGPEINTWEQEVFFLFGLYDFDRSGLLDGLEMMKLLSDYNSHHAPGAQANEQVVSMVDFLLQTQDLNQDGLLAPSELLSPALPHTQDSSNDSAPQQHQEQEVAAEEKLSNPSTEGEKTEAEEPRQEAHEEGRPQHEERPEEGETLKETDEHKELPEDPRAEQGHEIPVHQGQPEI